MIVPDEAPTVQAAIDTGAETVLVRPGFYPETITIDRAMAVRGLLTNPDSLPKLMGFTMDDTHQGSSHSAYLEISGLHFRGPVRNVFHLCAFSGEYHLNFTDCVMDSGLTDSPQSVGGQVFYSIVRSRITGGVSLRWPFGITFSDNTVRGPVYLSASRYGLSIEGNLVEGPGGVGIRAGASDETTVVHGNTVRGFGVGMHLGPRGTDVSNNLVEDCPTAGIVIEDPPGDWGHWVTGNIVRRCGSAFTLNGAESLHLSGNIAEDCASGISASVNYYAEVKGNRVSMCGTGLTIAQDVYNPNYSAVVSSDNVIQGCGGGLELSSQGPCTADRDTVTACAAGIRLQSMNSIAAIDSALVLASRGPGIVMEAPQASATHCVVGRSESDGVQISAPRAILAGNTAFLNGGSGFVLHGQGAPDDTAAANVGFGNVRYGLTIDSGAAAALLCNDWYGNSAGAVTGVPPGPTDLALNPVFCDLSASDAHLAPSSPLLDAPGCGLIGALGAGCPDGATAGAGDEATILAGFALARVGPVPTTGRIALELALPRAAAIEVTVHDIQGRAVARLASGEWAAGRHAIEWNGEGARGRVAPGLYLVRYRFPGGQSSRRIVISR